MDIVTPPGYPLKIWTQVGFGVSISGQGTRRKILSRESDHVGVEPRTVFLGGRRNVYPIRKEAFVDICFPRIVDCRESSPPNVSCERVCHQLSVLVSGTDAMLAEEPRLLRPCRARRPPLLTWKKRDPQIFRPWRPRGTSLWTTKHTWTRRPQRSRGDDAGRRHAEEWMHGNDPSTGFDGKTCKSKRGREWNPRQAGRPWTELSTFRGRKTRKLQSYLDTLALGRLVRSKLWFC